MLASWIFSCSYAIALLIYARNCRYLRISYFPLYHFWRSSPFRIRVWIRLPLLRTLVRILLVTVVRTFVLFPLSSFSGTIFINLRSGRRLLVQERYENANMPRENSPDCRHSRIGANKICAFYRSHEFLTELTRDSEIFSIHPSPLVYVEGEGIR